jgi:hypothetical protein
MAVRLFEAHGLKRKVSRSSDNQLVALARIVYGKPHSKGWSDLLRDAIDESKRREDQA